MPRAAAAAAARTAQEVLSRATELFAARGFADVSVDDVAQAAGVTRGAVYHHYGTKPGLFAAVTARLQAEVAAALVAAADAVGPDPREQLRAGSHAFVEAITTGPAVRILLVDGPAVLGWEQWRRLDAESSAVHLHEALRAASVPDDRVDAVAAQLSGAMNEAALWIAQHPDPATARARSHAVLDQLLDGVVP